MCLNADFYAPALCTHPSLHLLPLQFLDTEVLVLNEFLGAYPNYITGVSTCPFFTFRRYQFISGQHYNLAAGIVSPPTDPTTPPPVNTVYPFPTDAACTTAQPPELKPCPAMVRACDCSHSCAVVACVCCLFASICTHTNTPAPAAYLYMYLLLLHMHTAEC